MPIFHHDDDAYKRWIRSHPNGYVLNMGATPMLHRVGCFHLNANYPWPVEETSQPKVCDSDKQRLLKEKPKRCTTCNP